MTTPATAARPPARQLGVKLMLILLLTAAISIVILIINLLAQEREERFAGMQAEIAHTWGAPQTFGGPALILALRDTTDKDPSNRTYLTLAPRTSNLTADFNAQERKRGLFSALVYDGRLNAQALFERPGLSANMVIESVTAAFAISDAKGIRNIEAFKLNGETLRADMLGRGENGVTISGSHSGLTGAQEWTLDLALDMRGSGHFRFVPYGQETRATVRSPWPHFSATGAAIPDALESGPEGFEASWVTRNFITAATGYTSSRGTALGLQQALANESVGVRFFLPVDPYAQINRALKYAVLFIALTFVAFFLTEALTGASLHWVQYGLVGVALSLFYLLLLSLSEHMGFGVAYLVAAAAVTVQVTLYSASAFKSWARSGALALVMAALYGVLYMILRMEDYALLAGSLLLFVALTVTMYVTRNFDWGRADKAASQPASS